MGKIEELMSMSPCTSYDSYFVEDISDDAIKLDTPVSGVDEKIWVSIRGDNYLLKLEQAKVYTEHVGSSIYRNLGVPVQFTRTVRYNGRIGCLVSDIVGDNELRTFKCIHDSSFETSLGDKSYTIDDVLHVLDSHSKSDLSFIRALERQFVSMLVIDAIIANRNRHAGNWGYLCSGTKRSICPVFDCGSSLFPELDISSIVTRSDWHRIVVESPKSQVRMNSERKNTFYKIFESNRDSIDSSFLCLDNVESAITKSLYGVPRDTAEFYRKLMTLRYEVIIKGRDFNEAFRVYGS